MPKLRDISGCRFDRLVAVKPWGKDPTGKTTWACVCDCGSTTVATMLNLVKGVTKSCGCKRHQPAKNRLDIAGVRFGALVAIEPAGPKHWRCVCDCGAETKKQTVHLTRDHTRSCGGCRVLLDTVRNANIRMRNSTNSWAKTVRDWGKCEACGSKEQLHAHHIIPCAVDKSMTTDADNGMCLCSSCHREVHRRIGKGATPGRAISDQLVARQGECAAGLAQMIAGGAEDLRKAIHYIEKLIEMNEAERQKWMVVGAPGLVGVLGPAYNLSKGAA